MDDISSPSHHTSLNSSIIITILFIPLEQPSFHILNLLPAQNCFNKKDSVFSLLVPDYFHLILFI